MSKLDHAGVEVSSDELLVGLSREGGPTKLGVFPNNPKGHERICRFLSMKRERTVRVVLESTGVYGLDLAIALHDQPGIEVMVANPRAVRRFAEAMLKRGKNDKVDVQVLVEFVRKMAFRPFKAPSEHTLALRAVTRRIQSIKAQLTQERNRLHAASRTKTSPDAVVEDLKAAIGHCVKSIEKLTDEAIRLIRKDPTLKRRFELLISVKGIATASAVRILGELAVLPDDMDAKQLTALAGLDPVEHKSGKSVDKRKGISRAGNKRLRTALFMPAMVAIRSEPEVKAFYEHLIANGKKPLQAVVAVMRKLLCAISGMFKNDLPFDGSKFYRIPALAPQINPGPTAHST